MPRPSTFFNQESYQREQDAMADKLLPSYMAMAQKYGVGGHGAGAGPGPRGLQGIQGIRVLKGQVA